MQIVSLKLEDVKSYRDAEITFTPGTNAVVGQNGAGKSTVLEAIGFALFDALGYRQRDFVREGAKSATITVTFVSSFDERHYQIVRRCGSSTQYFVFDPDLELKLHEGKADVQGFLREHMGVESSTNLEKLFSDAVGVPQGTFTAAFLEGRAERKSKFDALLQVRDYEAAWSRLREPAALLKARRQDLDVEIAGMAARLEQLPALEAAIVERRQEIGSGETSLAAAVDELQTVQQERKILDGVQQELASLNDTRSQLESRSAAVESRLESERTQLKEAEEAAAIVAENHTGFDAYESATSRQKALDKQVHERQQLRDRRSDIDKSLALARAEDRRLAQELDEIEAAEGQVRTLQDAVKQQEALEKALAEEEQRATTHEQSRQELTRRTREADAQAEKVTRLAQQLAEAGKMEEMRSMAEQSITELGQSIQQGRDELAQYQAEADKLQEQNGQLENIDTSLCPVCEHPLTPEHREELMARNGQQLVAMRATYGDVRARVSKDEHSHEEQQQALRELDRQLRLLPRKAEVDEAEQLLSSSRAAIVELQAQVDALADVPESKEAIQHQIEQLGNPRQQMAIAQATAKRRADVDNRRTEITSRTQEATADLASVDEALDTFAELDRALAAVSTQLKTHAAAHQAVLTHRRTAESLAARKAAVEEIEETMQALAAEGQQVTEQLAALAKRFDEERFRTLLGEEQALVARQASLETQLSMLRKTLAADEETVAELQAVQRRLTSTETERATLDEQAQVLEDLRAVVRQAGPYITRALVQQIGDEGARIFGEIMQDHSRHLAWDEEYLVTLNVDGNERQFSQLSGGEQMSAAIAVRLALLRQMSNIDVAFFDEPTTNLDTARRESLAQQILNVDGLSQLFVISHDDTFEQATENLIRVERVDGLSRVVA